MTRVLHLRDAILCAAILGGGSAMLGASAHAAARDALEQVVVTATPLPGYEVAAGHLPFDAQSATAADLDDQQALSIMEFMDRNFAGVTINEAQSNPFQPDVVFRGFTASPLLGNPIGLSVFLDGVRVNDSFGDTVQWDLLPLESLVRLDLLPGANPVFGLNTLGGALAMRTTSGREAPGVHANLMAGSFDRRSASAWLGGATGALDGYVSGRYYSEDGWRDFSPSRLSLLFAKGGWQTADSRLELTYTHADNRLIGNGLVPESLQSQRREAIYTHPDRSEPELDFLNLTGRHAWSNGVVLTANAYWRSLDVETLNGDAELDDGATPTDPTDDRYEAENRSTRTSQRTFGAALQVAYAGAIAGRSNAVTAGVSWDDGHADLDQFEQAAEFTPDRGTTASGVPELDTAVEGSNKYLGVYVTDTYSVSDDLHVTAAGRYNRADVETRDRSGAEPQLDGRYRFQRFNPSAGVTYELTDAIGVYAGYSEGMRTPTPVELTCADPDDPCSLPVGFVSDPPLDPVVARSWEGGIRGSYGKTGAWTLVAFTSDLTNDILFTAAGTSQGFFTNVDKTRRRGFTVTANGNLGPVDWRFSYARVDATFETDVRLFNPVANAADPSQPATLDVRRGDRLPGVPRHAYKVGANVAVTPRLELGLDVMAASDQYLRGDESNDHPTLPGYAVCVLRGSYRISPSLRAYLRIDNVFDREYSTLGAFNRNAFDADGLALAEPGPGAVERFISPAMPRSFLLGIELGLAKPAGD